MDPSNNAGIRFTVRQYLFHAYLCGRPLTDREFSRIRTYEAFVAYTSQAGRAAMAKAVAQGDSTVENTLGVRWGVRGSDLEAALSWRDLRIPELSEGKDQIFGWCQPYSEELLSALRPYYDHVGPGACYVRLSDGGIGSIYRWLRDQEDDGQGRSPVDRESAGVLSALSQIGYRFASDVGCSLDDVRIQSRSIGD